MAKKAQQATTNYALALKVSTKGALSIYGMGRFPVTLYADQWVAILSKADAILSFINKNSKDLKGKPEGGSVAGGTTI